MKNLALFVFFIMMATGALAQTLFYDDFENRDYGFYQLEGPDWFGGTYYDEPPFNPRPRVVGGNSEVQPYQGNKMYEVRGSSSVNVHSVYSGIDGSIRQDWDVGFIGQVWLPKEVIPGQKVQFGLTTTESGVGIQLSRETGLGSASSLIGGVFGLEKLHWGAWNKIEMRLHRASNRFTLRFNGSLVLDAERQDPSRTWLAHQINIGTGQFEDITHLYDFGAGAPGIYIDDYHFFAVPEPTSLAFFAAVFFGILVKRKTA